jgi:hypothetical protein
VTKRPDKAVDGIGGLPAETIGGFIRDQRASGKVF